MSKTTTIHRRLDGQWRGSWQLGLPDEPAQAVTKRNFKAHQDMRYAAMVGLDCSPAGSAEKAGLAVARFGCVRVHNRSPKRFARFLHSVTMANHHSL